MNVNLIPFYTENKQGQQNYTLLLDKKTELVYKAYHKKTTQWVYWIGLVITLGILREMQDIFLPVTSLLGISLLILLGIAGIVIGIYCYKKMAYEEVREIYLTEDMIEEYLRKGKSTLRIEAWTTLIIFIGLVILSILFFVSHLFIWLLFAFYAFVLVVVLLCRLPIGRFKLIKKGVI
ncbi:hypothetical protein WMZ97_06100 [Lentibacillus sp. N15]|uniref:hypothetical protein n=1 Tax=Lentibacillus songyuanensis TaxID=3136161 RepID=UPI0031BB9949